MKALRFDNSDDAVHYVQGRETSSEGEKVFILGVDLSNDTVSYRPAMSGIAKSIIYQDSAPRSNFVIFNISEEHWDLL